jgi:hypothetical protein
MPYQQEDGGASPGYDLEIVERLLPTIKPDACLEKKEDLNLLVASALCLLGDLSCYCAESNLVVAYAVSHILELSRVASASTLGHLDAKVSKFSGENLEFSIYGNYLLSLRRRGAPRVLGNLYL